LFLFNLTYLSTFIKSPLPKIQFSFTFFSYTSPSFIGLWNSTFPPVFILLNNVLFMEIKTDTCSSTAIISVLQFPSLSPPLSPLKVLYQNSAPFFHMSSDQQCDNPVARVMVFIHVSSSGRQLGASGLIIVKCHCLYIRTCWINTEVTFFSKK